MVDETPDLVTVTVEERQRQAIAVTKAKRDLRVALRAVADRGEDLVDLRAGDRRFLDLQVLRDGKRRRRSREQGEHDQERGVAPQGAPILDPRVQSRGSRCQTLGQISD